MYVPSQPHLSLLPPSFSGGSNDYLRPTLFLVAAMSRPVAGTRKSSVIITLPGSPKGAVENLTAIIRVLPNACLQNAGLQPSRNLHAGGVKKLEADTGISPTQQV